MIASQNKVRPDSGPARLERAWPRVIILSACRCQSSLTTLLPEIYPFLGSFGAEQNLKNPYPYDVGCLTPPATLNQKTQKTAQNHESQISHVLRSLATENHVFILAPCIHRARTNWRAPRPPLDPRPPPFCRCPGLSRFIFKRHDYCPSRPPSAVRPSQGQSNQKPGGGERSKNESTRNA